MSSMPLPDFIIGGAPRSATTWLYEALDRHPEIFMAKPVAPEPKFFLVDETYQLGLEHYSRKWFSDAPPTKLKGEKSTNYLESPIAAERIRKDIPHIKLFFVLRNPIERAYSNYLWSKKNGMESENFTTALQLEEQREKTLTHKLRFARPHAYFSRGLYAKMLAPYLKLFPRQKILCVRQDDISSRPEWVLNQVHGFLGVSSRPKDGAGLGLVNAGPSENEIAPQDREYLRSRYTEPNRELARLLSEDFESWNSL